MSEDSTKALRAKFEDVEPGVPTHVLLRLDALTLGQAPVFCDVKTIKDEDACERVAVLFTEELVCRARWRPSDQSEVATSVGAAVDVVTVWPRRLLRAMTIVQNDAGEAEQVNRGWIEESANGTGPWPRGTTLQLDFGGRGREVELSNRTGSMSGFADFAQALIKDMVGS